MLSLDGWVKLHRRTRHSHTWRQLRTPLQRLVMVMLIPEANFADRSVNCSRCGKESTIPRGTVWLNKQEFAAGLGVDVGVVKRALRTLLKDGFISIAPLCCKRTAYAIANYEREQGNSVAEKETRPQSDRQTTFERPSTDPETGYVHKKKEERRKNTPPARARDMAGGVCLSSPGAICAQLHRDLLVEHDPGHRLASDDAWRHALPEWANHYAWWLRKNSGYDYGQVCDHLRWAFSAEATLSSGQRWADFLHAPQKITAKWETLRAQKRNPPDGGGYDPKLYNPDGSFKLLGPDDPAWGDGKKRDEKDLPTDFEMDTDTRIFDL